MAKYGPRSPNMKELKIRDSSSPTTPAATIPRASPQKYSAAVNSGLIDPIADVYSLTPPS